MRLALGAGATDMLWLVLRNGIRRGIAGVTLGLGGATMGRMFLACLVLRVSASDPLTLSAPRFCSRCSERHSGEAPIRIDRVRGGSRAGPREPNGVVWLP